MLKLKSRLDKIFGESNWEYRYEPLSSVFPTKGRNVLKIVATSSTAKQLFDIITETTNTYYLVPNIYGYCDLYVDDIVYTIVNIISVRLCMWLWQK